MYPEELTNPMRAELSDHGVAELRSSEDVSTAFSQAGTCFVLINSVCGCAAGGARPAVLMAKNADSKKPHQITTAFAGVDPEAVAAVRGQFPEYPASSPSMALLQDGDVVWMMHRHQIEGRHPGDIAADITAAFEEFC